MEGLVNFFIGLFGGTGSSVLIKQISVFVISCMPILELRGGLLAASILDLQPLSSYIICVIGNILPIPFVLLFIEWIFKVLKKTRLFKGLITKIENKALSKKDQIEKFGFWGLVLFVGIPLPGTGAWTGSLIAVILHMDKKKAFLAALIGVIMASIIMMLISFGLLKIFI